MLPLPCGEGTVADSALIRLSSVWNLDCPGIVRLEHLEQSRRGHTADRKFLRTVQKVAAAHPAMHVSVEKIQKLLRKVRCLFAFHGSLLVWR